MFLFMSLSKGIMLKPLKEFSYTLLICKVLRVDAITPGKIDKSSYFHGDQ